MFFSVLVICDSKLWTRIVRSLKVNMATFVKNHCEDVVELIITNKTDIEVCVIFTMGDCVSQFFEGVLHPLKKFRCIQNHHSTPKGYNIKTTI